MKAIAHDITNVLAGKLRANLTHILIELGKEVPTLHEAKNCMCVGSLIIEDLSVTSPLVEVVVEFKYKGTPRPNYNPNVKPLEGQKELTPWIIPSEGNLSLQIFGLHGGELIANTKVNLVSGAISHVEFTGGQNFGTRYYKDASALIEKLKGTTLESIAYIVEPEIPVEPEQE